MPSSRGSFSPRDQIHVSCVSCIGRWVLSHLENLEKLPSHAHSRLRPIASLIFFFHLILQVRCFIIIIIIIFLPFGLLAYPHPHPTIIGIR